MFWILSPVHKSRTEHESDHREAGKEAKSLNKENILECSGTLEINYLQYISARCFTAAFVQVLNIFLLSGKVPLQYSEGNMVKRISRYIKSDLCTKEM